MMNFVENPCLVVVDRVLLDRVLGIFFPEPVHNFNCIKHDIYTSRSTTGNIVNLINLYSDLNFLVRCDERHLDVPSGLSVTIKNGATSEVNPNVTLLNGVESLESDEWYHNEE